MKVTAAKITRRQCLGWAGSTLALSACGGGGGGGDEAPSLSATQLNWEASAVKSEYFRLNYTVPGSNEAFVSGTHHVVPVAYHAAASASGAPQALTSQALNATKTLPLPDFNGSPVRPDRYLKAGRIFRVHGLSRIDMRFSGSHVISDHYATDGLTLLYSLTYTDWSTAVPLSGLMSANPVPQQHNGIFRRNDEPQRYDFNRNWLEGASYVTRKALAGSDRLIVWDSNGDTVGDTPSAVNTLTTTLEAFFQSAPIVNAGGWGNDGIRYLQADGVIGAHEGTRVWIANQARPITGSATPQFLAFIELNGKIYRGGLVRSGTAMAVLNGLNTTQTLDHDIRYNRKAVESLQAALKF